MQIPKVSFFKINNNQEKLFYLLQFVEQQFNLGLKTLIACETKEASLYLDDFFWRFSDESFLPHAIIHEKKSEMIAITTSDENLNQAKVLVNLKNNPHPLFKEFTKIFEFYDETHPTKKEASKSKHNFYHEEGCIVV